VSFSVVDIVDFLDHVPEYLAAEDVLCVVTEVLVAASLSDELLPEFVILV
jgi:hypothetical protein